MFAYSISGIRASMALMEKAAMEVSRGPKADILQSQVDMIIAKHSLGANIAALKTASSMQQSIIDILA